MKALRIFVCFVLILQTNAIASSNSVLDAFTQSYYFENNVNYTSAIEPLKEVYTVDSYEINLRLGWLCYKVGLAKESMEYYTIAAKLQPNAIEPLIGFVYAATSIKENDLALEEYKKILAIVPMSSQINYHTGYLYYLKKDYQNALKHFQVVVDLYPFDYDGLLMYAWTIYRLGKNEEAKKLFNQVLLLSPADRSATEGLALIK